MSRLLKSRDYVMKCLGFVLLFGFISLGAIGGCNNNNSAMTDFLGVHQTGQTTSHTDGRRRPAGGSGRAGAAIYG